MKLKVLLVFGTRPEAIKMAPLVHTLRQCAGVETRVCVTGQHREMLDDTLAVFDIRPDDDLAVMRAGQGLSRSTARILVGVEGVVRRQRPDWVLVQGDTTTALAASLAAMHARVKIGHVEAGLRTGNSSQPWPEEVNRRMVDGLAHALWPATEEAKDNLVRENLGDRPMRVTGNTGVDALLQIRAKLASDARLRDQCRRQYPCADGPRRLVLVTAHRRETLGPGLSRICDALARLARRSDIDIVFPVHPNPHVREPVTRRLAGFSRIHLIDPVPYPGFVYLMHRCHVILTDSGGIQEEAPVLGRPVLLLRDKTERPDALQAGTLELVGTDARAIEQAVANLLDDPAQHARMSQVHSPFGDGQASRRIAEHLCAVAGVAD